jgi:predicted Zn-dependent peptidase
VRRAATARAAAKTTISKPSTVHERSEPLPGLRLVSEAMPHVRSVSVGLWIDVGSRDEADELGGASHFLEHLLFKGTNTRSAQEIANAFDHVGGEVNAYSAREHTCFYARVLDEDLPMALEVLADMFRDAALRPDEVESERRVILEEIHMASDVPEDLVHELFSKIAWPSHPLGRSVLGTPKTVDAMSVEQIDGFYRGGYVTDRLVLAVAGNVDHGRLEEVAGEMFLPGVAPVRRSQKDEPVFGPARVVHDPRGSEQVHLVWGVEGLSRTDPDRYALSVLGVLYGGGMSSRLFQEIREKRGLAYSIYSGEHLYLETGNVNVYAGTQPQTAAEVLKIIREEAAALAAGEVTEEEVERAKGHVRGGLVLSMDDPGGRMSRIGRSELVHGEVATVDDLLGRVEAVTPQDITRVAERIFGRGEPVLACVGPVGDGALDFSVEPLAR